MAGDTPTDVLLALSAGFSVHTRDGVVGVVETPLFPPDQATPDFLVVRVGGRLHSRHPVVAAALVEEVDASARVVRVRGARDEIARLPEHLPIAI